MRYCPINLDPLDGERTYSESGLRSIHPKLIDLKPLPLTGAEQIKQVGLRWEKMSIQGVQPKLSAVLRLKDQAFDVVDTGGTFVLKPNPPEFEEVPANEALTMRMAAVVGIEVPPCGLVAAVDGSWVYFIKRFDRHGRGKRLHVEDFSQLAGAKRETKYDGSLEKVASLVQEHCTFPALEIPKLAKRLLFCFLTGNEDMHLKNFSLLCRDDVVTLAPAYDLLNTTLVLKHAKEESALSLQGKKKNLNRELWIEYFLQERLRMDDIQIDRLLHELRNVFSIWSKLIDRSLLSEGKRRDYHKLLRVRSKRILVT